MSDRVYLTSLEVKNLGGIEHFKAEIGQIAIFSGENGCGKTSCLNAIMTFFEGGSDPDFVRSGCDSGETTVQFSNGYSARKEITRTGYELAVTSPEGGKVKAPATWLKDLAPSLSFDPIGFLESDPKERASFLLQNLPLTFDSKEIADIAGTPLGAMPVSLQRMNELRQGKYDERTNLNRKVRDMEGDLRLMQNSLPADLGKDWGAERERLNARLSSVGSEITSLAAQIELEAEQEKTRKRSEIQAKIDALNAELSEHLTLVDKTASDTLADSTAALESERATLSEQLGTAKAKADQEQQAVGIRNAIVDRKKALEGHISEEMRLSEIIERLDKLKHAKLKELPIEGLDLKLDSKGRPVILIGGLPLDKLNRQQQLYVAIQAVSLAEGKLPLILCEAAELDDKHVQELSEAAKGAGLQLVLARWENDAPLQVRAA